MLASSTLSGQQQTIAGASANVHVMPRWNLDGTVEIARAWYDAQNVAMPDSARPGGYYHVGLIKTLGRATASIDAYRMEPNYATIVLPYGVPENQWGAAWAWPSPWLGSSFQLVDNSVLGVNRQGLSFALLRRRWAPRGSSRVREFRADRGCNDADLAADRLRRRILPDRTAAQRDSRAAGTLRSLDRLASFVRRPDPRRH